jgi:hypothetical protein
MSPSEPNFILSPDEGAPRSVEQLRRQALRLLQESGGDDPGENHFANHAPHDRAESAPAAPAPARAVMIGLVTMPAVFIVVVMGALALFGKPAATEAAKPQIAAVETLAQPAGVPAIGASFAAARSKISAPRGITLGEDMRVADISLDGDRVALHVESPMGEEIVIYDYARGEVVAQAPIETASVETVDSLAMLTGAPQPAPQPAEPTPVVEQRAAIPGAPTMKPRQTN